jgi:hypothetical protein
MPLILKITDEATEVDRLRVRLDHEIDQDGVIAILRAISALKPPKKKRPDAGKPRTKTEQPD